MNKEAKHSQVLCRAVFAALLSLSSLLYISYNTYADGETVTITKDGTEQVDYAYSNTCNMKVTSRYKVDYGDGRTYIATCVDPGNGDPRGTGTVTSKNNEDLKKILLVMNNIGPLSSSFISTSDWSRFHVNQKNSQKACPDSAGVIYRTGVNHAFAVGHVMASYKNSKGCDSLATGSNALSCSDEWSKVQTFFNNASNAAYLSQYVVKSVPGTSRKQEIAWLEPYTPPTPTVTSTTLSSTSSASPSSVSLSYDGTDTRTVTFTHKVSRTANSDITSVPYKTCFYQTTTNSTSKPCTPGTSRNMTAGDSGNLSNSITIARGDSSGFGTGTNANTFYIAAGETKSVCEYIRFSPTTYNSDGSTNEGVGSSHKCVTVSREAKPEPVITYTYEYPTATFLGRVIITPADSSKFDCTGSTNGSTCTAKSGTSGSQTFNISYELRRTDSDEPSDAQNCWYSTTKANYDNTTTGGYWIDQVGSRSYSTTFTQLTSGTESRTITAGAANPSQVCGYLTYDGTTHFVKTNTYSDGVYQSSSISAANPYAYESELGKAATCINIVNPTIEGEADFSGEVNISPSTTYTNLSCSGNACYASRDGTYTFNRFYKITRTDSNSNTLATKVKYSTSSSSYPTSAGTDIPSAIAYNSSPKYATSLATDTPSVTFNSSNRGGSQNICGYIRYENVVYYKTENGSTTENTGKSGNRGTTTAYKCITVYAPPPDQSQNFTASTSFLSGSGDLDSNLTWNSTKNAYIGKEATGSYTLKFNHEISRGSPDNSANIPDAWATNTYALKSGSSSSTTTTAISGYSGTNAALNSSTHKISSPHTYTLSAGVNSSNTYCERIDYKPWVKYAYGYLNASDRIYGTTTNTSPVCRTVIRPAYSTFEGRIKITSTWNGNQYSTDSGDEGTLTGGGKRKRYGFNIVFEMRRTDTDSMPSSPKSRYKVSYNTGASQPTSASGASEFTGSDTDWHQVVVANAETIDVSIGTTTPVNFCAYLTYDTAANYYGSSTPEGRNFDGKKKFCVKITNPSLSYKSTFSASSKVTNPGLHERADGTWEVINYSYNSTTNSYSNANLPKSYTVIFPHTLTRTDTGTPSFKLGDSGDNQSSTRYKIQESLNDAAYSNVSGGTGTKKNFTQSGDNKSQIISAQHSFSFNRSGSGGYNVGSIVKYCQKIVYDKETTYNTIDNPNDVNSYSVNITRSGYDGASVAKCITIRNPNWIEYYSGNINFPITVLGSTILKQNFMDLPEKTRSDGKSPLLTSVMENLTETNNQLYTAKTPTVTAKFEHELHRIVEDFPVETSISVTPGDTIAPYNVPRLQKPTDSVSPSYNVKHKIAGTVKTPNLTGTTVTLAPEAAWNSYTKASGSTTDSFTKTSLLAGQTKQICHKILDGTYNYHINYQKLWRQETYTDTSENGTAWHFRTDRISSSPVSDGSTDNATEVCVRINRPYNYKVNDVTPSESGHNNGLGYIDDEFQPDFNINVVRDDTNKEYITDMESANTTLSVFEFVVNKNAASPDAKITNNGTSNSSTDSGICTGYYTFANKKFCRVLESGKQPVSHVGNAVSGSPYSYTTSYTPAKITIPATLSDGTKLEPGDKYCMSIAIKKESSSSSNWFVSKATCVSIAKKPTMQVWGGSILSNGKVKASTSSKLSGSNRSFFGSWTDFALISRDDIKGMASGAGLAGGKTNATKICGYSHLTISDATCRTNSNATTLGHSTNSRDPSAFFDKIKDRLIPSREILTGNNLTMYLSQCLGDGYYPNCEVYSHFRYDSNGTRVLYNKTGILYIPNNTRGNNKRPIRLSDTSVQNTFSSSPIFYSNNSIEITANLINDLSNKIEQIVIISEGDILIDQNVSRIDAWLITEGTVNTCSINGTAQSISDLNTDKCTTPLVINGPVYADSIVLSRTYGADHNKADGSGSLLDPAERINFTPSTLLWPYNHESKDNIPSTVYLKELSPRY